MDTNKENQKKQSEETKKNKDTSNSLENDVVGEFGSQNPTPQGRTDIEQDKEKKKRD